MTKFGARLLHCQGLCDVLLAAYDCSSKPGGRHLVVDSRDETRIGSIQLLFSLDILPLPFYSIFLYSTLQSISFTEFLVPITDIVFPYSKSLLADHLNSSDVFWSTYTLLRPDGL